MKILFLSQIVPYPPHGGVLQRGYNIIRQMSKYFDLHLLAFIHPDILSTPEQISQSKRVMEKYCSSVEYFDLWPKKSPAHKYLAFSLGFFSSKPFSVLAHRSAGMQKRINELLSGGQIDLVHFDTIGLSGFYSPQMLCPSVLTHHNIESTLMARRGSVETNILKKKYICSQAEKIKQYEAQQSSRFTCNIMMSENDSDLLRKIAPAINTAIVPNGVDTDYFFPQKGKETEALIYTGGMNMYANKDAVLFFLAKIWPRIKAEKPDCIFYAVGQDPPVELRKIAATDSSVKVMGYVDDVRPLVAKSSVYVVPLRVGGGTRLKIVDAMAQGKAIVSTSIGCEGLTVHPGEDIITADEPQEFAQEVLTLLNNPAKCQIIGDAARRMVVAKYSWDVIGQGLEELYSTFSTKGQHRKQ